MVDLPSSPLAVVDPEFEKMGLETGEFTFGLSGTSVREKLLQVIANDVCRAHLGLAYRMHLMAARMHDIPYADLLALLRFIGPYAGYPAAADALERLGVLGPEIGFDTAITADPGKDPVPDGRPGQPDVAVPSTDEWLAGFLASRTGRAWSEERLTARERAIVAITTDVSLQNLDASFRRHVALAGDVGMSADDIRDVVRFTAELCSARTVAALAELEQLLG
jgi:alkylhydroperoxidase/carboxymuconolactone decarboxylase family protein YurZ